MNTLTYSPDEVFALRSNIDLGKGMTGEHEDLIGLSLEAIDSTITEVASGIDEGTDLSNSVLASLLYGLTTHLGAIRAVASHARTSCPQNNKENPHNQQEATA